MSRSRNFQLAASRSEKRWHGFTRTIGLKYLRGDFELGQDEDKLEFGSSKLLFAEGTLSRRRVNDRLAPRKGYVIDFGVRLGQRRAGLGHRHRADLGPPHLADSRRASEARIKLRGEVGAMTRRQFRCVAAGPALLRGRRSLDPRLRLSRDRRGERERHHHRRQIPRGRRAANTSSTSREDWGAAVFVDAGDAFTDKLQR